jgi:hypothetical protein
MEILQWLSSYAGDIPFYDLQDAIKCVTSLFLHSLQGHLSLFLFLEACIQMLPW